MKTKKNTCKKFSYINVKSLLTLAMTTAFLCIINSTPASAINADQPAENWQTIHMRVTAYCPCEKCCGNSADGITANGHSIQPGDTFVAADSRFAFGTELIIPGYSSSKPVKVIDRGGAIKGNKLDVFFHTHQEALEWGVQYLDVKVRTN